MKKKTYKLLAFLILPMSAAAQPTLTTPELYNTAGTVVKRVFCDPVAPGPSGTNQTWDFTGLSETGDTLTQMVGQPVPGNPFPSANLSLHSPQDSMYTHYEQTTTESWQWGSVDSSSNQSHIIYSDPMLMIRRPLAYSDTATDSFAYTSDFGGGLTVSAQGGLSLEADAYGTLYLPHDTFTNTVRVRVHHQEEDSIDGIGTLILDNTYYVWYSNDHSSPLLRVDSLMVSGLISDTFINVQMLVSEGVVANVKNVNAVKRIECTAHLDNNGLLVNGSLENGKHYEVALFSINGQQVFKTGFVAAGALQKFDTGNTLSSGTYILTIRQKGDMNTFNTIKVVKQ